MPEVMTKEYCEKCPWFVEELGWLEGSDPYWEEHPDMKCACKTCPNRRKCEADGPTTDIIAICFVVNRDHFENKLDEAKREVERRLKDGRTDKTNDSRGIS